MYSRLAPTVNGAGSGLVEGVVSQVAELTRAVTDRVAASRWSKLQVAGHGKWSKILSMDQSSGRVQLDDDNCERPQDEVVPVQHGVGSRRSGTVEL